MASGVEPTDLCVTTYQELKLGRKYRYIIYGLNDAQTGIVVNKASDASDFGDFVKDLPRDQCRWAVYDFEFEKDGEGKRSKLCFVSWSPDVAKVKEKMVFAASREALRRRLDGIAFEIQGTDPSEITYNTVLEKALTCSH